MPIYGHYQWLCKNHSTTRWLLERAIFVILGESLGGNPIPGNLTKKTTGEPQSGMQSYTGYIVGNMPKYFNVNDKYFVKPMLQSVHSMQED